MRRRLDLAAALVARPPVLFLDEPTTGLDPRSRVELWETIEELVADGTTVLLTTQYLDEADRLADRIAVIDHGQRDRRRHRRRAQGPRRRRAARGAPVRPDRGDGGRVGARRHGRRAAPDRRQLGAAAGRARRRRDHGGGPPPRRGEADRRRRGDPPPDARRRLPRPHRPPGRAEGRVQRTSPSWRWSHDPSRVRRAGDGRAQPRAPPARPRPADRLHDPAGDVRAAVRLRVRRRDQHAGLRLHRLPDPGDHRPEHRVRRLRHRARAGRGPATRA